MALSTGNETLSLLLEKNPELFFLLEYAEGSGECIDSCTKKEMSDLPLNDLLTLYVYGISSFYYQNLRIWLSEKKERRLIFLIHDVPSLRYFLKQEDADVLLLDEQVVLFHFADKELAVQELVSRFPCNLVEVLSSSVEKEAFVQELRLDLLRKSTLAHAIFSETLHSPKLLQNVLSNISFWKSSFLVNKWKGKFAGVPAVICGAGPSLQNEIESLRALEDRALLFAGGSTITALSRQGINPHLSLAIDPNPEEFERLKEASSLCLPLIYGTRLEKDVLACFGGERGYIVSDTGGPCERYFEEALGIQEEPIGPELGMEALSVTTLSVALAVHMGCDPILFCGVDLAYTQGKRYASEVLPSCLAPTSDCDMRAAERFVTRKDIQGKSVQTLVKWVMESECIGSFAKKMAPIRFINVSEGGLGFPGIENRSLRDVMGVELQTSFDLKARVHAEIQMSRCSISSQEIKEEKNCVSESLTRVAKLIDEILSELERLKEGACEFPSARFLFLEMEMKEESAFACLHPYVESVLDILMERWYLKKEEQRELSLAYAKYKAWRKLVSDQSELFSLTSLASQAQH